jgi:hypothetical protein
MGPQFLEFVRATPTLSRLEVGLKYSRLFDGGVLEKMRCLLESRYGTLEIHQCGGELSLYSTDF